MKKEELKQKIKDIVMKYHKSSDKNDHVKALSEIAELRGGNIKDGEVYVNNSTKMTFIDKLGNEFQMDSDHVKNGYWSPYESDNIRDPEYHMKQLEKIVKSKGGKVKQGEVYINANTKMKFIDKLGNEFQTTPHSIKRGHWSPYEAGVVRESKHHIKQLQQIAKLKGGKIKKGEKYTNSKTKIVFIDKAGNEFKMTPNDVKNGRWSPYESGNVYNNPEYHMKQLEEIAKLKGGRIKEGEIYINNSIKMAFIDKSGNEFKMSPSKVKSGSWSPIESGHVSHSIDYYMKQLEDVALSKGGKIKEGEKYINNRTKMIFIDKLGNEFKMTPSAVNGGNWSPYESGKVRNNPEYHMKQLEDIALSKGGRIKEGEFYLNNRTKMTFIDKNGYEFQMSADSVKSGSWSPYEAGSVSDAKYHMKELREIAKSKGGKIKKGEKYINSKEKITFIDKLGNEFQQEPRNIKSGKWSPYEKNCSEHICRQIIEQLYSAKFNSCWNTIKRVGKRNLQLDGYCPELKIAFEYQGIQHIQGWKSKKESLELIKQRDKEKKQICKDMGILLLEINYYKKINDVLDIINTTIKDIKESYKNNNLSIPEHIDNFDIKKISIDFSKINNSTLMYEQLEKIAKSKGGRIKEGENYINSYTKMTFIDKFGNEFKMNSSSVKRGYWSPYESKHVFNDPEYHIKQLEKIAKSKGGKIKKGEKYINTKTKMIFIDKQGNEFEKTPNDIKNGLWSPHEVKRVVKNPSYYMKRLEEIAKSKNGKIKEGEIYKNSRTKIIFIDKLGNEFQRSPEDIKNGKWSPYELKNF